MSTKATPKTVGGLPEQIRSSLADLRAERGLTTRDVAERTGLNRSAVSALERGVRQVTVHDIEALSKCYGVEPVSLFGAAPALGDLVVARLLRRMRTLFERVLKAAKTAAHYDGVAKLRRTIELIEQGDVEAGRRQFRLCSPWVLANLRDESGEVVYAREAERPEEGDSDDDLSTLPAVAATQGLDYLAGAMATLARSGPERTRVLWMQDVAAQRALKSQG